MFFIGKSEVSQEQRIVKNTLAFEELMIQANGLDREIKTLLEDLKVSPQQLSEFISNQNNFTSKNWEQLQQQKAMLDEKLSRDLQNIKNPLQAKKKWTDRRAASNWILVR